LLVIGIVWLVIAVIVSITICNTFVCDSVCIAVMGAQCPPPICGCSLIQILLMIGFLGIPSWILFLIVALTKEGKSKKK